MRRRSGCWFTPELRAAGGALAAAGSVGQVRGRGHTNERGMGELMALAARAGRGESGPEHAANEREGRRWPG